MKELVISNEYKSWSKNLKNEIGQQPVAQIIKKPWGHNLILISKYQLIHILPDNLKSSLPCLEELEAEFADGEDL